MTGETDLDLMLAALRPLLHGGAFQFRTADDPSAEDVESAVVVVRELEGTTLVVPTDEWALDAMAWITLQVHSSLQAVGLTAAVSAALAAAGIACNVVAGFHHDHLFVPSDRRDDAMAALESLNAR